jgi:hypothetical protein
MAVLLRRGAVASWLEARGVSRAVLESAFPDCGWPLDPPLSWTHQPPDPSNPAAVVDIELHRRLVGELGDTAADASVLSAITLRRGRVSEWLASLGVDAAEVEAAFPGSCWS